MNLLSDLTVIILTYKTDRKILTNCIQSIDKNVQIKLIENSGLFEDKDTFEKNFPNLSINCTGANLGYGGGNNYGFNLVKTNYALILNPDVVCHKGFFDEIRLYLNDELNYSIIGTNLKNDSIFKSYGYFNENKNNKFVNSSNLDSLTRVDWVVGCAMLIKLDMFNSRKIFDENFFLYFEESDLCKSIKDINGEVYTGKNLLIDHLGFKGSFNSDPTLIEYAQQLRNWHWMWSTFYFYKKNYGLLFAYRKTIIKLFKSIIKFNFYNLIGRKPLAQKYKYRFLGLWNSMIGKKSWYRIDLDI